MSNKKRGLGSGFSALGLNELLTRISEPLPGAAAAKTGELLSLPLSCISPGKSQPRQEFDATALQELAESIRSQGVIQPIIVRKGEGERFEIIAGERRWRAAKLAGLEEIPVVVRDISDETAVAVALIENIQRENLNAIEEATALHRLSTEFSMTHQEIAQIVGKSRTTITNLLRLLSLPLEVKKLLTAGQLEMGHARALLSVTENQQPKIAELIGSRKMSVRETEDYIRRLNNLSGSSTIRPSKDPLLNGMEKNLSRKWGTRVSIQSSTKGTGKLIVHYKTMDQLKKLVEEF